MEHMDQLHIGLRQVDTYSMVMIAGKQLETVLSGNNWIQATYVVLVMQELFPLSHL